MSLGAPDPTAGGGMGGGMPPPGGAGGGQGVVILQQIQQLLAQLLQSESDPAVQRAAQAMMQLVDPLMQAVGQSDQGDMTSGLSNPGGMPEGSPGEEAGESPGQEAAEQASGTEKPSKSFSGAKKAAMANFGEKGHFSKSGSKGEQLQTEKTKNRMKVKASK